MLGMRSGGVRVLCDGGFASDGELFDAFTECGAGDAEEFCGADLIAVGHAHCVEGELPFQPGQQLCLWALFSESQQRFHGLFAGDLPRMVQGVGRV